MNLKSPLIGSFAALALLRLQFSFSLYCQRKQVLPYVTGISDDGSKCDHGDKVALAAGGPVDGGYNW